MSPGEFMHLSEKKQCGFLSKRASYSLEPPFDLQIIQSKVQRLNLTTPPRLSAKFFIMKTSFHSYANKTNFHMKSFALSLAFIVRLTTTRKWPTDQFRYIKNSAGLPGLGELTKEINNSSLSLNVICCFIPKNLVAKYEFYYIEISLFSFCTCV